MSNLNKQTVNNLSQSHNSYNKNMDEKEKEKLEKIRKEDDDKSNDSDSDSDMSDLDDLDEEPIKYDHGITKLDITDQKVLNYKLKLKEINKAKNYKELMRIKNTQEKIRRTKNDINKFKNKLLFPYIYTNLEMYDQIIKRTVQDPELVDRRTWVNCIKESGFSNNNDLFKKLRTVDPCVESQLLLNFSAFVYTSFSLDENHRNEKNKPRGASLIIGYKINNITVVKKLKFKNYFDLVNFIDNNQIISIEIDYLNFPNCRQKSRLLNLLKVKKIIKRYVPNNHIESSYNSMISELFQNFKQNEIRTWQWARELKFEQEMVNYNKLAKAMQFDKFGSNPVYLQKLKAAKPQYYDMLVNKKPKLDESPIPALLNQLSDKYCPHCDLVSHYFDNRNDNVCNFCDNIIYDEIVSIMYHNAMTKANLIEDWFVAGMLDLLKTIRVGDFYDDLLEKDKKTIVKHDMLLLNKFLRLLTKSVINIPVELSDEEALQVQTDYYFSSYRFDNTILSPNPSLYTEFNCAVLYLASLLNSKFNLYYSPVDIRLNGQNVNFVEPTGVLTNVMIPNNKIIDNAEDVFFSVNLSKINLINVKNSFYIIRVMADALNISYNKCVYRGVNNPQIYDINLNGELNRPVMRINKKYYLRKQLLVRNNVAIYCYESTNVNMLTPIRNILNDSFHTILWLPDPNSISLLNGFNIKPFNIEIKMKMLKALCIYNLAGDKSLKELTKYCVGYLYRKFIIGSRVIKEESGDNSLIRSHVLLASLSMLQLHGKHLFNHSISEAMQLVSPLLPDIKSKLDQTTQLMLTLLLNWFPQINNLKKLLPLLNMVKTWSKKLKTVSGLHHITDELTLNLMVETDEVTITNEDQPICSHHFSCSMNHKLTEHICVCCNMYFSDQPEGLCECCSHHKHSYTFDGENEWENKSEPMKQSNDEVRGSKKINEVKKPKETKIGKKTRSSNDNLKTNITTTQNKSIIELMQPTQEIKSVNDDKLKLAIEQFGESAIEFINYHKNFKVKTVESPFTWVPCVPEGKICYLSSNLFKIKHYSREYKQYNPNDCGIAVSAHLLYKDYDVLYTISSKKEHLSALDIIKIFKKHNKNVLILTSLNCLIHRSEETNKFNTIIHSDLIDDSQKLSNHFYYGQCELKEMHNLSYVFSKLNLRSTDCGLLSLIDVYDQFVKHSLFSDNFIPLNILNENRKLFLTNNKSKKHNLIEGLIHMSVDEDTSVALSNLLNYNNNIVRPFIILENGLPKNYKKYLLDLIKALVYDYVAVHDKIETFEIKSIMKMVVKNINGKVAFSKRNLSIKSLDKVLINYNGKQTISDVLIIDNDVMTSIPFSGPQNCEIQMFKQSHGSLMRRILTLCECINAKFGQIEAIMNEATLVKGGPGCGKTTAVMNKKLEGRTIWVAQTRSIVNATKKKVKNKNVIVRTIESSLLNNDQFDNLVIDECYQIDWVTAYLLVIKHNVKNVVLLGDEFQIKYKNMMRTNGLLPVDHLITVVKPKTVEEKTETFRFDKAICDELNKMGMNIKPNKNANKTTLQVLNINLQRNKKSLLNELILENKIDVLLTFDHITYEALCKDFNDVKNLQIAKVHGYQGCETKRVLVYQSSLNKNGSLHTSREYIISALTRAKNLMLWVINIPGFTSNDIMKTITNASCYDNRDDEILLVEEVKKDETKYMNLQSWLEKSKIKYDIKELTREKDLYMKFTKEKTVFLIKNVPVLEVIGDKVVVLSEKTQDIQKILLTNPIVFEEHSTTWFKLVALLETNIDNQITFELTRNFEITVHKTSGCSIGANTIIFHNKRVICHTYTNYFTTKMFLDSKLSQENQKELVNALKCKPTNKILMAVNTLKFNYFNVLFERQAHRCMYDEKREKQLMIDIRAKYKRLLDKTQLNKWNLSSEQNFGYIISGRKNNYSLEIFSPFEEPQYQDIKFNDDTIEHLLYYLIHRAVVPRVRIEGIDGLLIDLETHMERETEVGKAYKRKLGELKLSQTSSTKDIMWLSAKVTDKLKDDIKTQIPNVRINSTGVTPTLHPVIELLENLTIIRDYRANEEDAVFGGLNVSSLVVMGLENLNLMNTTKNTGFVTELKHNLSLTDKLIKEKMNAVKKDVKLNIFTDYKNMGGKILMTNFTMLYMSFNEMYSLLSQGLRLRILLPTNYTKDGSKYYRIVKTNSYYKLMIQSSDWAININSWLVSPLMFGKTHVTVNNKRISFKPLYSINDMCYFELFVSDPEEVVSRKVYISSPVLFNRMIRIKSWVIQTDLVELLQTGQILYLKEFVISSKIYETFMMRLMTGEDDIKSLLFFARTLASTFRTTDVGPNYIKETPLEIYISTAYVAFAHHHQLQKTAVMFQEIINLVKTGGSLIESNAEMLIKNLLALMGLTDKVILHFVSEIMNKLFSIKLDSDLRVLNEITRITDKWIWVDELKNTNDDKNHNGDRGDFGFNDGGNENDSDEEMIDLNEFDGKNESDTNNGIEEKTQDDEETENEGYDSLDISVLQKVDDQDPETNDENLVEDDLIKECRTEEISGETNETTTQKLSETEEQNNVQKMSTNNIGSEQGGQEILENNSDELKLVCDKPIITEQEKVVTAQNIKDQPTLYELYDISETKVIKQSYSLFGILKIIPQWLRGTPLLTMKFDVKTYSRIPLTTLIVKSMTSNDLEKILSDVNIDSMTNLLPYHSRIGETIKYDFEDDIVKVKMIDNVETIALINIKSKDKSKSTSVLFYVILNIKIENTEVKLCFVDLFNQSKRTVSIFIPNLFSDRKLIVNKITSDSDFVNLKKTKLTHKPPQFDNNYDIIVKNISERHSSVVMKQSEFDKMATIMLKEGVTLSNKLLVNVDQVNGYVLGESKRLSALIENNKAKNTLFLNLIVETTQEQNLQIHDRLFGHVVLMEETHESLMTRDGRALISYKNTQTINPNWRTPLQIDTSLVDSIKNKKVINFINNGDLMIRKRFCKIKGEDEIDELFAQALMTGVKLGDGNVIELTVRFDFTKLNFVLSKVFKTQLTKSLTEPQQLTSGDSFILRMIKDVKGTLKSGNISERQLKFIEKCLVLLKKDQVEDNVQTMLEPGYCDYIELSLMDDTKINHFKMGDDDKLFLIKNELKYQVIYDPKNKDDSCVRMCLDKLRELDHKIMVPDRTRKIKINFNGLLVLLTSIRHPMVVIMKEQTLTNSAELSNYGLLIKGNKHKRHCVLVKLEKRVEKLNFVNVVLPENFTIKKSLKKIINTDATISFNTTLENKFKNPYYVRQGLILPVLKTVTSQRILMGSNLLQQNETILLIYSDRVEQVEWEEKTNIEQTQLLNDGCEYVLTLNKIIKPTKELRSILTKTLIFGDIDENTNVMYRTRTRPEITTTSENTYVINDFDNKDHHWLYIQKWDEHNTENKIILNNNPCSKEILTWLNRTKNASVRLIVQKGLLYWALTNNKVEQVTLMVSLTKHMLQQPTNVTLTKFGEILLRTNERSLSNEFKQLKEKLSEMKYNFEKGELMNLSRSSTSEETAVLNQQLKLNNQGYDLKQINDPAPLTLPDDDMMIMRSETENKIKCWVKKDYRWFEILVIGGSNENFVYQLSKFKGYKNSQDKWNLSFKEINSVKEKLLSNDEEKKLTSLEALNNVNFLLQQREGNWLKLKKLRKIMGDNGHYDVRDMELNDKMILYNSDVEMTTSFDDISTPELYDLWENLDQSSVVELHNNLATGQVIMKQVPVNLTTIVKHTVNEFPAMARPYIQKLLYTDINVVTKRLFGAQKLRKFKVKDYLTQAIDFANTYFKKGWLEVCEQWMNDPLVFNYKLTREWLLKAKYTEKIKQELLDWLDRDLALFNYTEVHITTKMEAIFKEDNWNNIADQNPRIIVWPHYKISAIVSPLFKVIKSRFKTLLHDKFFYTDGLTPTELDSLIRTASESKYVYEGDLSKQDRQTDESLLGVEMYLYVLLGLELNIAEWWSATHGLWKFKTKFFSGYRKAMRQTGTPTTALGNVFTNFQVHKPLVKNMWENIVLFLGLGDDNAMFIKNKFDIKSHVKKTKLFYNMLLKCKQSDKGGKYCSFTLYKDANKQWSLGPDFIKLKYKYELTNGVSELNKETIKTRKMSYLTTVGKTKMTEDIVIKENLPITLFNWYNFDLCNEATAHNWNTTINDVERHYGDLIKYLSMNEYKEKKFLVFTHQK